MTDFQAVAYLHVKFYSPKNTIQFHDPSLEPELDRFNLIFC